MKNVIPVGPQYPIDAKKEPICQELCELRNNNILKRDRCLANLNIRGLEYGI